MKRVTYTGSGAIADQWAGTGAVFKPGESRWLPSSQANVLLGMPSLFALSSDPPDTVASAALDINTRAVTGLSADVPTLGWGTTEPAGTVRLGPGDPRLFVSGIPLAWNGTTTRWPITGPSARLFEVVTTGTVVALGWICQTANAERFEVYVDGVPTTSASVAVGTTTAAGTIYWLTLTFGADRRRRVQIVGTALDALVGVNVQPTSLQYDVFKARPRVLMVTDSFGGGGGTAQLDAMPLLACLQSDVDFMIEAEGGSGYNTNGSNGTKFGHAAKVARAGEFNPDLIVYLSGVNDDPNVAGYAASVSATRAAYASACPSARHLFVLPMPTGVTGTFGTRRPVLTRTIAGVAATNGDMVIDSIGLLEAGGIVPAAWSSGTTYAGGVYVTHRGAVWKSLAGNISGASREPGLFTQWALVGRLPLTGTGNAGTPAAWGTRDNLLMADDTHRTAAGHVADSIRLAQILRDLGLTAPVFAY